VRFVVKSQVLRGKTFASLPEELSEALRLRKLRIIIPTKPGVSAVSSELASGFGEGCSRRKKLVLTGRWYKTSTLIVDQPRTCQAMSKKNPLNLNPLQLKTLTLLQELARSPQHASAAEEGAVLVRDLPRPHGDHFHIGAAVALTKDATGLGNAAVWVALERKGLIKSMFPLAAVLTPAGLAYDTGLAETILHRAQDH
jgi:hypothetical protein